MDPQRYRRVKEVYFEASAFPEADREAYLVTACAGDAALEAEVRRLLATRPPSTDGVRPGPARGAPPEALRDGTRVGEHVLVRVLGVGGMGRVYEARADDGSRVAIKVFHPHLLERAGSRARFHREVEIGRRVTHPCVVRTLGAGSVTLASGPVDYLVMEYVQGRTLRQVLDHLGSLPEGLVREIGSQAARGLEAVHEAGAVHRDVKPENLLLTEDHRLRITDLGVAKVLEGVPSLTSDGQFVGSLHYAAPEQLGQGTIGPATDLYALGVVLYELATGSHPFAAESPAAMLRAHLERVPTPAVDRGVGVSPFLSAVLATLLAKDPRDRFPSAAALAGVLEEGESAPWWRDHATRSAPARPPLVAVARETAMYGRVQERERLEAAWGDAREGHGRTVLLVADAGFGKTRLVGELLQSHATDDAARLYGAFEPGGGGGLRSALARYFLEDAPEERIEEYLGESRALLPGIVAWLRRQLPPADRPLPDLATRNALAARLLTGLAARRPVLWVVEDLHHAGADALTTVFSLARAAAGKAVLLVLTSREPLPPAPRAELGRITRFESVPLGRIPTADVEGICRERFDDEDAARRVGPRVAALADGVPLFALEILRGLEIGGRLTRTPSGRYVETQPIDDIEVPPTLRELVGDRLHGLTREEAEMLDVAAVAGGAIDPDLVARVRGVTRLRVLEVLGHLEKKSRLVRSDGATLRFDHPLIGEVVYDALPPALRQELHRLVAEAILAGADGPDAVTGQAAAAAVHHHLRGATPDRALPLAPRAIEWLSGNHHGPRMVDVLVRLREVRDVDPVVRVRYGIHLGRTLQQLGRSDDAQSTLAESIEEADRLGDPGLRVDARAALGYLRIERGEFDGALQTLDEVSPLLGPGADPARRADALGARGQALWCLGRYEDARRCHEEALALARDVGLSNFEARASSDLAVVCHELGELDRAEALLRRAIEIQRAEGTLRNEAVSISNLANVLHDQGRKAEALESYEASLALCRKLAFRDGEAVALVNLGEVHLRLGAPEEAERAFRLCARITRETGSRRVEAYAWHGLGLLDAMRGDRDAAESHLERALALRREIQNMQAVGDTLLALGALHQDQGDTERAAARLGEALAVAESVGDTSTATLAGIRLALLGKRSAEDAEARYLAARPRLRHDAAAEASWLLWRATGKPGCLETARALLASERANAPAGAAERMLRAVPVHREVEAARRA